MKRLVFSLLLVVAVVGLSASCHSRHTGPRWDVASRKSLDVFARQMAKKYQLRFMNSGVGGMLDYEKCIWALNYNDSRRMTIEEGRPMARAIAQAFYEKVHEDHVFADYHRGRSELHSSLPPTNLSVDDIGFKIAFWDENVNRPLYPYLAQIRFVDGEIRYYYADSETQALQDPIVEPFSGA